MVAAPSGNSAETTGELEEYIDYPMDGNYILMNDIDLCDVKFTPIGSAAEPFTGTFDGRGHRITGLHVDTGDQSFAGLFGVVGTIFIEDEAEKKAKQACIKNLEVEGDVSGGQYVGLIAGCVSSGATIENCSAHGDVAGLKCVGGVAGQVLCFIGDYWCYRNGNLTYSKCKRCYFIFFKSM